MAEKSLESGPMGTVEIKVHEGVLSRLPLPAGGCELRTRLPVAPRAPRLKSGQSSASGHIGLDFRRQIGPKANGVDRGRWSESQTARWKLVKTIVYMLQDHPEVVFGVGFRF